VERISQFLALEGNIRVLAIQTLLSQIGLGMFYVIWQPYTISTGVSISQLGLIQTIINVSTGISLFFWGYISDKYGRKPVIITCLILRIMSMIFLIISKSYWAFIGFGAFMGFTAMFYIGNPARSALITESVNSSQRATALSTIVTISQGTSTIVATLGGYIALKMGFSPIFYILIIGDTIGVLTTYKYLEETLKKKIVVEKPSVIERLKNSFAPEPQLFRLYIALLIMGFSYTTAYSLLFGVLSETFRFTPVQLGFMTTAFNLLWTIDSIPLGKFVDKIGGKNGILFSLFMGLITPIGFLFSKRIEYFIFFYALQALDIGFWIPGYTKYITGAIEPEKRSTVFGKLDAYGKIGSIPAAWIAGLLYERYGFFAPLYIQIVVILLVASLLLGLKEID
jgi:MFS family permease